MEFCFFILIAKGRGRVLPRRPVAGKEESVNGTIVVSGKLLILTKTEYYHVNSNDDILSVPLVNGCSVPLVAPDSTVELVLTRQW